ncbi:MAG TPA: hypothetical protein DHW34_07480 [Actinobacteria bacterium]|nr:hypothetical protein [Actinomycetota bacterium]
MPFFLGFPFLSNEWLRKDTLLVLLLIACLVTMRGRLSWQRIVLLNVLCIVGILTHEMFIFVGVIPIVALAVSKLRSDDLRISQSIVRVGTLWSPTFLTTAAVVVNKGSSVQAEAIWRSWRAVPLPDDGFVPPVLPGSGPQAAVESLTWTVSRGFDITKGSLKVVSYHIPALLAWPLTIMIVVIVSVALVAAARRSVRAELNSPKAMPWEISQIACAYLLGLASLLPLFVIGVDYGRWIFMWVALSTAILLFAEKQPTSLLLNGAMKSVHTWLAQRNHLGRAVAVMNQYFQWAVRRPLLWVLLAPLMAVPPAYWQAYVQITPVATIWRTFMG